MSFWIMLLILCISSLIGGIVNYLLPANSTDGKFIKPWWQCVILGFGATLLVPIFLELAQSKLLENIHFNHTWEKSLVKDSIVPKEDTLVISTRYDSTGKAVKIDTAHKKATGEVKKAGTEPKTDDTGKNYFLWASYCLLAAAAGFKFIYMLINKVVLVQQLDKEKGKNEELTRTVTKQAKQAEEKQKNEEIDVLEDISKDQGAAILTDGKQKFTQVILPPVKYLDDPQKGRFGGLAERNNRCLKAGDIEELSNAPNWFKFKVWVESTDEKKPLTGQVIFYLHNTFYKSVRNITVKEGVAELLLKKVYGAFTVGAVADNGETFLELDLAEEKTFPKKFRDR